MGQPSAAVPVTHATPVVVLFRNTDGEAADAMVIDSTLPPIQIPTGRPPESTSVKRAACTLTAVPGAVSQGTWKLICVGLT